MEKLSNIPVKTPFRIPENYFGEVNKRILASTAESEARPAGRGLFVQLKPFLAVAASIVILITLTYTAVRFFDRGSAKRNIIREVSLQEFAETYLNDIDITTLELNSDPLLMSGGLPGINKSEIIDYLLLENIDENEIYELL